MDRFPEAFQRFKRVVDTDRIESFRQLTLAFGSWAGQKWQETPMQMMALKAEAKRLGISIPAQGRPVGRRGVAHVPERKTVTWRHEVVTVRGSSQSRYRDLGTGRFIRKP